MIASMPLFAPRFTPLFTSLFTSARERRLWLWTGIVLATIYSTLGPAATVAAFLRERGLLRISVTLFVLLVVGGVAWRWLRRRPRPAEIAVALGIAGVYAMTWFRIPIPEERTHLIEYGVVALLIHQALLERRRHGRRVPLPALLALVATALLGLLDEGVQALLPNRVYDPIDVGFNAFAAVLAIGASVTLAWVRRRVAGRANGGR